MTALLWTVLATSLVGSLHCAGMCGPLVAFYSGNGRGGWTHAAYNGGRGLVYVVLGAIAGGVGAAVDLAGDAADIQQAAPLVAGGFIVAWGGVALARAAGFDLPLLRPRLADATAPRLRSLGRKPPVWRATALGLLTAAMPCGWLYAFVAAAAATGSAATGAAVMLAFWLGTVPVMLGMGLVARRLAHALGRRLPVLTALLLIAVGLAAIVHRPVIDVAAASTGDEPACH